MCPEPGGQPSGAVCGRNLAVCLHGHAGPLGVIPAEAHRRVAHTCPLSLSVHSRPCLWTCVCFSRDLMPVHRLTSDGNISAGGGQGDATDRPQGCVGVGQAVRWLWGPLGAGKAGRGRITVPRSLAPYGVWKSPRRPQGGERHSQEVNATQREGGRPASQNLEVGDGLRPGVCWGLRTGVPRTTPAQQIPGCLPALCPHPAAPLPPASRTCPGR